MSNLDCSIMKKKYVLIERDCNDFGLFTKIILESRFKTDIDIMKMRCEAKRQKGKSYSIQEYITNLS